MLKIFALILFCLPLTSFAEPVKISEAEMFRMIVPIDQLSEVPRTDPRSIAFRDSHPKTGKFRTYRFYVDGSQFEGETLTLYSKRKDYGDQVFYIDGRKVYVKGKEEFQSFSDSVSNFSIDFPNTKKEIEFVIQGNFTDIPYQLTSDIYVADSQYAKKDQKTDVLFDAINIGILGVMRNLPPLPLPLS